MQELKLLPGSCKPIAAQFRPALCMLYRAGGSGEGDSGGEEGDRSGGGEGEGGGGEGDGGGGDGDGGWNEGGSGEGLDGGGNGREKWTTEYADHAGESVLEREEQSPLLHPQRWSAVRM